MGSIRVAEVLFLLWGRMENPSEAAAAVKAVEILDSKVGEELLEHLRKMTVKFEQGLLELGFETIASEHPVVPLVVRDTEKTSRLVKHLFENQVLATGLNYPVVPKGSELIRFQISAEHKESDIDYALEVLANFK